VTGTTLSSLVVILAAVALAPMLADLAAPYVRIPAVIIEILAGILIGPALGWAHVDDIINFLSELGLCTLMFLAGLEIDLQRIRGGPLRRALTGWGITFFASLALGAFVAVVDGQDAAQSGFLVGLAVTTTAFGILLPIMRDSGELATQFGTEVLAGSAIGELGPIVAIAILFGTDAPGRTVLVLLAFVAVVLLASWMASREPNVRLSRMVERTLTTSGQVAIRLAILFLAVMVWLASELGLDVLLGAFAAGMVTNVFASGASRHNVELFESKLTGIGFGFVVPLFFVVSGMKFDLDSVFDDPLILIVGPAFLVAFLVLRGLPAALTTRAMPLRDRVALGFFLATQLPLVVVIASIGVETNRLNTSTAAALVAAAMVSVLAYPMIAARLRQRPSAG
jgi:Kef-type K+ transport system membrane component KefB